MSRAIKFRAWDKEKRKMIYAEEAKNSKDLLAVGLHGLPIAIDRDSFRESDIVGWNIDHFITLMQFTGLVDTNGKEIYEGDIIQTMNPFSEKHTAYVVWDTAQPMYTWMIGETWMLHFIDGVAEDKNAPLYPYCQPRSGFEVTVIGNIHQNPELLK